MRDDPLQFLLNLAGGFRWICVKKVNMCLKKKNPRKKTKKKTRKLKTIWDFRMELHSLKVADGKWTGNRITIADFYHLL